MSKEINEAQLELLRGYYNKIVCETPDVETIIQWLEKDMAFLESDNLVEDAKDLINTKWETSQVKCSICSHEWTAVRPEGSNLLECPNCSSPTKFINI